jgi:hypothetical protein
MEEKETNIMNGYGFHYNSWVLDKNIKNELRLLLIIASLCSKTGYCFASNSYFTNYFEEDVSTISRKIKKLEELNYIKTEYKYSGSIIAYRKIYVNGLTNDKNINGPMTKISTANDKNVKDNNISNNNKSIIDIYIREIEKFKLVLSSTDYALINEFIVGKFTIEQVKEAISICENNNACSIKYLIQVLVNPQKEKTKVALKSGINPIWLNEDLQADNLSSKELEELEREFKEFRK